MNTSHLSLTGKKRIRNYFGNISEAIKMPNLIEIQKTSYEQFLDSGFDPTVLEGINDIESGRDRN